MKMKIIYLALATLLALQVLTVAIIWGFLIDPRIGRWIIFTLYEAGII